MQQLAYPKVSEPQRKDLPQENKVFIFNTTINNYKRNTLGDNLLSKSIQDRLRQYANVRAGTASSCSKRSSVRNRLGPSATSSSNCSAKPPPQKSIPLEQRDLKRTTGVTKKLKPASVRRKELHKAASVYGPKVAGDVGPELIDFTPDKATPRPNKPKRLLKADSGVPTTERQQSSMSTETRRMNCSAGNEDCGSRKSSGGGRISSRKAHQANVRVVARIRPANKIESSLLSSGVGEICCKVYDGKMVCVEPDNQQFAFDRAFGVEASQAEIYDSVGKETVADVLSGYNGTILAYGQTGSGKTYTMFGPDIYDEAYKGIIPRVAVEIFRVWEYNPNVKEFLVSCSMLEIYKENLRDLLTDEVEELKIKESPQRGIYVEGLSEMPIGSEDELMYWIEQGEGRRVWAETRQNFISSRSHALFILEVKQVLANDSETRGILNLVDLAGCEKVGKSGAHGQIFEEGTKINLSLSALGNVIHALTAGSDHVPYRDSKLTRLLQESLGGNYKTSLIVTCSPHSSQLQETQSTLKFAQRAKKIRNRVQVNVKSSPDQLNKIIEQLKDQLREKSSQIERLMSTSMSNALLSPRTQFPTKESSLPLAQIEEKDAQRSLDGRPPLPPLKKSESSSTVSIGDFGLKEKDDTVLSYDALESKLMESEQANKKLEGVVEELKHRVEMLTRENASLELKLRQAELKLIDEKKHVIMVEDKLKQAELTLQKSKHDELKKALGEKMTDIQNSLYSSQIKALSAALEDAETECFKLLKEKKSKFKVESSEMYSLTLSDYIAKDKSCKMFGGERESDSFLSPAKLFSSKFVIPLEEKLLLATSKYSSELEVAVEGNVNPETVIYLLKNQLVDSGIVNHNLRRVISLLIWKLGVERASASVKGELGVSLQKTVDSLEGLLGEYNGRGEVWRRKIEKLEFDLSQVKQQVAGMQERGVANFFPRPRIKKTVNRKQLLKQVSGQNSARHGWKLHNPPKRPMSGQVSDFCRLAEAVVREREVELEDRKGETVKARETFNDCNARETDTLIPNSWSNILHMDKGACRTVRMTLDCAAKDDYAELESSLKEAQIEQRWHKTLSDLLMEELLKCREQIKKLREQVASIESSAEKMVKDESQNWSHITSVLRGNYDKELARKQKDINSLHDLLAQWVLKYMDLERSKAVDSASLSELFKKTYNLSSSMVAKILKDEGKGL